jgi:hypothetical protein
LPKKLGLCVAMHYKWQSTLQYNLNWNSYLIELNSNTLSEIWIQLKKSFNIQELLHHKSKCHGTKPMHPSSSEALQRYQEQASQLVDLIITK